MNNLTFFNEISLFLGVFLAPRLHSLEYGQKITTLLGELVFAATIVGFALFYNAVIFQLCEPGRKCSWVNSTN